MLVDASNLAQATGPVSPLDLASGSGVWGIALAQASSHVTVHAVDWPDVLPVMRRVADRFGVGERFMMVESARNRAPRIIAGDRRMGGTQPNYARCSSAEYSSPEGRNMPGQIYHRGDGLAMPLLVTIIMAVIGAFVFFQFGG